MHNPERIKNLRLRMGLGQDEFAKLLNVTVSTISNWEHGRRVPRMPHIREIIELAKKNKIKLTLDEFVDDMLLKQEN